MSGTGGLRPRPIRAAEPGPAGGLQEIYARIINYAIAEKPADMVITTHVCRGNFRSTWISSGGYEPVAEVMLGGTNYDGYFLEYDSDRAGGFDRDVFACIPEGLEQLPDARGNGGFPPSHHHVPGGVAVHFRQNIFHGDIIPLGFP